MGKRPTILRRDYTQDNQPAVLVKDAAAAPIFDATPRTS
jgi:hypothetical protein